MRPAGHRGAERLPRDSAPSGPESKALGAALAQFALSHAGLGDSDRAPWYAAQSKLFELSERSRMDTEIAVARADADPTTGIGFCERFLRRHVRGEWDDLPLSHRKRGLTQYSSIAHGLSNKPFAVGHRMDPGGPITGAPDTPLTALAFAAGPRLPYVVSPHGYARFRAIVGIATQELRQMQSTGTREVLKALAEVPPLF